MLTRTYVRNAAAVLATLGLGAGLGVPLVGCGRGEPAGVQTEPGLGGTVSAVAVPALDTRAPSSYQTATFALG